MRLSRASVVLVSFLCVISLFAVHNVYADVTAEERAALQTQLAQVQAQITQNQAKLADEQSQEASLNTTLAVLDSQITEAQLEIKQRNLTIQELKDGVSQDNLGISVLDSNVAASQASLAQIMQHLGQTSSLPLYQQLQRALREAIDKHIFEADEALSDFRMR